MERDGSLAIVASLAGLEMLLRVNGGSTVSSNSLSADGSQLACFLRLQSEQKRSFTRVVFCVFLAFGKWFIL